MRLLGWNRRDEPVYPDDHPEMPRYCGRCGERLELIRDARGFSTKTGEALFAYWLSCPRAERKDTPYTPYRTDPARAVTCDGLKWDRSGYSYYWSIGPDYVDCTPWPKPKTMVTHLGPTPPAKARKAKA